MAPLSASQWLDAQSRRVDGEQKSLELGSVTWKTKAASYFDLLTAVFLMLFLGDDNYIYMYRVH